MLKIIALNAAGVLLLCIAAWCSVQQINKTYYTMRDFTDFSGDIQAWLRSENV